MQAMMKTQQAADRLHISAETLRRWQREGRVSPESKTAGGHALWSVEQIEQISQAVSETGAPPVTAAAVIVQANSGTAPQHLKYVRPVPAAAEPQPQLQPGIKQYEKLANFAAFGHTPVILVNAPKGGTGATNLAVDVALLLSAQDSSARILIMEVDDRAQSAIEHRLTPARPAASIVTPHWTWGIDEYPVSGMAAVGVVFEEGVWDTEKALCFAAPLEIAENVYVLTSSQPWFNQLEGDTLAEIACEAVDHLSGQFDVVIVDSSLTPDFKSDLNERADLILMPAMADGMTVSYVHNWARRLGNSQDKLRVVIMDRLNEYDPQLIIQDLSAKWAAHAIMWRERLSSQSLKESMPMVFDHHRADEIAGLVYPLPGGRIAKDSARIDMEALPAPSVLNERKHASYMGKWLRRLVP